MKCTWSDKIVATRRKNNSYIVSNETRRKISLAKTGKKLTPEHINAIKVGNTGNIKCAWSKGLTKYTDERLALYSKHITGKVVSEETCAKISIANKGKKKPKFTKTHKLNISTANTGKKRSIQQRNDMSKRYSELWKNDTFKNKMLLSLWRRPTSLETKLSNILIKYSMPFVYVGDGKFLLACKNPDFIDITNKVAIEVYSKYFKLKNYGSIEKYQQMCIDKYSSVGWKVIFFDENELADTNCDIIVLDKICDTLDYYRIKDSQFVLNNSTIHTSNSVIEGKIHDKTNNIS